MQRINGKLITNRTKNLASAGEHYYFTYNKLLHLIETGNLKTNNVILGVSIHNFAPSYNRVFNIETAEGKNSLKKYLYVIPLNDNSGFINNHGLLLSSDLFLGVYSAGRYVWGGHYKSTNSTPSSEIINKSFESHYSKRKKEEKFSISQRTYLYKIDSLCTANKINLTLVSTPYHTNYKEQIKPEYYDFFSETLQELSHRPHINFLDNQVKSDFMADGNHLNILGSTHYSKLIGEKINLRTHNNVEK